MTAGTRPPPAPRVALLHWGDLLEDFLDSIGVSFDTFRHEMTGGWMFGYVEALLTAGIETVLVCFSARVSYASHAQHTPTGATICVIPVPGAYRVLRGRLPRRYSWSARAALGDTRGWRRLQALAARQAAPYLATPLRLLARELRRHGCLALLCQEYEHPRFDLCVLLGRTLRLPVIGVFQGGDRPMTRIERPLRALSVPASSGLVVGPASEARRIRARYRLPAHRLARVYNPLDLGQWGLVDRDAARADVGMPPGGGLVVAWHGRVDLRRKGLDVLLDAWQRVRDRWSGPDLRLLLVGTGTDAAELRARLDEGSLRGVHWVDEYVTDRARLRDHLTAADVYAFPSRHEGFPVALIEAMACGLPVVAADAPGVPDILPRGADSGGLVVPRGDAPAFADALLSLLADEAARRALGSNARRRVEACFAIDAVGTQLCDFLAAAGVATRATPEDTAGARHHPA